MHSLFPPFFTLTRQQVVLSDLSRAREGLVLASDLHLVYLITPINVEELPVTVVCEAYKVAREMIQGLQENAGRFASMSHENQQLKTGCAFHRKSPLTVRISTGVFKFDNSCRRVDSRTTQEFCISFPKAFLHFWSQRK
ncbi:hypothetical protein EJ110_NYTH37483 [Nymphaea thermarum]|nr:hypothetical protein EJ110_NYTH37483 [Nymphaea thermarum]